MFITLYVGLLLCGKDGRSVHRAGQGGGYIPRRCTPANSNAPGTTAHDRQQGRPCPQQTAHRHTRPDAGHAAPVCTRYQTGRAGQIGMVAGLDCLRSVSETEQIRTHTSHLASSHIFVMFCCPCNGFALYKVTQV